MKTMFRTNDVFDDTYRIEREIGRGGTSVVYLAYHIRLKKYVVIKRVHTDFTGSLSARTEVDILKNLHHAYLPQVYDILQFGSEVYTVMDYIDGWGLDQLIHQNAQYSEAQLYRWMHQLLEVLDYLHSCHPAIIHSDIKPSNIIITSQGNVCLIDFNISLDGTEQGKITGYSQYYAAPEQQRLAFAKQQGIYSDIRLDARTDLYSLAATFYTLITGLCPSAERPGPALVQLAAGRYTPEFLELIDRAMNWNPAQRYRNARKMLAALEHIRHKDSRYRLYVGLQALSWICGALLLSCGIYCAVRGVRADTLQRYRMAYNSFAQAVYTGNDTAILEQGAALLRQDSLYATLCKNPEECGMVLHAVGDCYYNMADYAQAATYYLDALQVVEEQEDEVLDLYYEDAAIALALSGNTLQAEEVLQQAEQSNVAAARCDLILAAIKMQQGNAQECIQIVRTILENGSAEICARACLLAADAAVEPQQQLEWLERANSYQSSRQTARRMGALYMEMADSENTQMRAEQYRHLALECYQAVCAENYPTREDRLNLAVVQLSCGQSEAAIQTLLALKNEQADDDYLVEMNLAFAYDAQGNLTEAAAHGSLALRLWRDTAVTDREPETSESIQNLLELQKRLNF